MHLLDKQLEAGIHGDFKTGWKIVQQLEKDSSLNQNHRYRANFNKGWYLLKQGKLLEGHKLLDQGRFINIFGNPHIGTNRPIWNKEEGTVILNLEGGLGDQIKSYRFAFDLKKLGNRVILSSSSELAKIFSEDFPVVAREAIQFVYHDYWLPSMSSIIAFEYEYKDLKGTPYISRTADIIPGRIGVRWSGNPKFEHEQHRLFSSNLMFDTVKDYDCVSLQKDNDKELKPDWMKEVDLSDWTATRREISKCELIITSCTSIAHLAGAMGIETWIVVPVLSYYIWALPGNKSPYYDSVTLYRQEKYGDWLSPFKNIKQDLEIRYKKNRS